MLNKKGAWVADVKREKEIKAKTEFEEKSKAQTEVLSTVKQYFTQLDSGSTSSPPSTTGTSSGATVDSALTLDHVKGLLASIG